VPGEKAVATPAAVAEGKGAEKPKAVPVAEVKPADSKPAAAASK
jgi:hypothetical protein